MELEIVLYGHPALRAKGRKVGVPDGAVRELAGGMLDAMRAADGVGLAAQQVGMPLQLCVVDIGGVKDRPSEVWMGGTRVGPATLMPMVLVDPEIELSGPERTGTEGCLSFPGLRAEVPRPERVGVAACDLDGRRIEFEAGGLLSRAIQHEFDHLQGVLFIDRLDARERRRIAGELARLLDRSGIAAAV